MNTRETPANPKTKPQETDHQWDVNYSLAFARAVPTALMVSVVTNPMRIWQLKKSINEHITWGEVYKAGPLKGVSFGMGAYLLGTVVFFNVIPISKHYFQACENMSPALQNVAAFSCAGMVETVIGCGPNIYVQKIHASDATKASRDIVKAIKPRDIYASCKAALPFHLLGSAVFLGVWGHLISGTEKQLHVQQQPLTFIKALEEFSIGACSGSVASIFSYGINGIGNRRNLKPSLTFKQDVKNACQNIKKENNHFTNLASVIGYYYGGFLVSATLRLPTTMGLVLLGKMIGEEVYGRYGFFAKPKPVATVSCEPTTEDEFEMLARAQFH